MVAVAVAAHISTKPANLDVDTVDATLSLMLPVAAAWSHVTASATE